MEIGSFGTHREKKFHERAVVIRRQILLGGVDQKTAWRQELLDEICVVVEMGGDEDNVVFVISAQQLVQERTLLDALLVEIRFEAVVGEGDDLVGACGEKLKVEIRKSWQI
jgi:hypothetical protein